MRETRGQRVKSVSTEKSHYKKNSFGSCNFTFNFYLTLSRKVMKAPKWLA